jgi:hypothetical protein
VEGYQHKRVYNSPPPLPCNVSMLGPPRAELRMQLLAREQYFLDKIKPESNINLKAGSNLGMSYSPEGR